MKRAFQMNSKQKPFFIVFEGLSFAEEIIADTSGHKL